jgi:hypothetical protein
MLFRIARGFSCSRAPRRDEIAVPIESRAVTSAKAHQRGVSDRQSMKRGVNAARRSQPLEIRQPKSTASDVFVPV